MNLNILILCLIFVLLNCEKEYILSLELHFSGNTKYDIELFNRKSGISDNDLFYCGNVEYMDQILIEAYSSEKKSASIKNENHPLVFMFETCLFEYINYFPSDTMFVVSSSCLNYAQNYSEYTIFSISQDIAYYKLLREDFYYVKIGKALEEDMKIFFYIMIGVTLTTSLFLRFIMRRILKNMNLNNLLLINFIICYVSDLLLIVNITNCFSFFVFTEKEAFDYIFEYIMVFMLSLFKGMLYSAAILMLKGWMIITFNFSGNNFKKYLKRLMYYELFSSLLIHFSIYFIDISSKLNLFFIKEEIEQIVFISFFVYCIIKNMIPLYKQMKYEQSIRSDMVECLKFKYKKLFKIFLILGIHALCIIISPIIETRIIYKYIYNLQLHYLFTLFIETNFCLGLNIIFIPENLPENFFSEIIYNYKGFVYLEADLFEKDDEENHNKKLNISKLTFNDLKKAAKKENYPIILLNPYASSKDQLLFNDIHVGFAQKYEKN